MKLKNLLKTVTLVCLVAALSFTMVACGANNRPTEEFSDVIEVRIAGSAVDMPSAPFFTWSAVEATTLAPLAPTAARPVAYAGDAVELPTLLEPSLALATDAFGPATLALLTPALTTARLDAIQGANTTEVVPATRVTEFTTAWNALRTAIDARNSHHTSTFGQTGWTLVAPTAPNTTADFTFNGAAVSETETQAAFLTRVQTHNDRLAVRRSHEVAIAAAWSTLSGITVPTGTVDATSVRPVAPATATTGALAPIAAATAVDTDVHTLAALTAYNTNYLTTAFGTEVIGFAGAAALARAQVESAISTTVTTDELTALRAYFAELQGYNALITARNGRVRARNLEIAAWNASWATGTVDGWMNVEGEPVWTSAIDMELGTALRSLLATRAATIVTYMTGSQTTIPAVTAADVVNTRVRSTLTATGFPLITDAALATIVNNELLTAEERTEALVAAQLPLAGQTNFALAGEVNDLTLRSRTVTGLVQTEASVSVYGTERLAMTFNRQSAQPVGSTVANLFAIEEAITSVPVRNEIEFSVVAEAIRPDWLPHPPVVEQSQRIYIDGDLVAVRIPFITGGSLLDLFGLDILIITDVRAFALLV